MIGDIRVGLSLVYGALVIWRGRATGGTPDNWWMYIAVFAALNFGLTLASRLGVWWQGRMAVQKYRAMGPARQALALKAISSLPRGRQFAERVRLEGQPDIGQAVERYPFARGARVAALTAFITAIALGAALLGGLVLRAHSLAPVTAWTMWIAGCVAAVLAAWARRRLKHTESVLEISAFSIAEAGPEGKRMLRWGGPLLLSARPRWRRLELRVPGQREYIALDYDRVGIDRALQLVLHFGGFAAAEGSPPNEQAPDRGTSPIH